MLADPERIGQVLRNLLSNAAKYSPEGTPIELRVIGKKGRVRLEVADRGPGIHPEDVTRIFEKFGRGRDREGRKMPGVGLGLYLSQRIVRGHGSELTVRTRPGGGSVFGFDLEVARWRGDQDRCRRRPRHLPRAARVHAGAGAGHLTVVARPRSLAEAREVLEAEACGGRGDRRPGPSRRFGPDLIRSPARLQSARRRWS